MMKTLRLLGSLLIALFLTSNLTAQVSLSDSTSNLQTCNGADTMKASFNGTTGPAGARTIIVHLPTGHEIDNFLPALSSGGTISLAPGSGSPRTFNVTGVPNNGNITIYYTQSASCAAGTSSYTANDSFEYTDGNSVVWRFGGTSFNGVAPELSITSITNTPSSVTVGTDVKRQYTVTNGGFGATGDFILVDKANTSGQYSINTDSFFINPAGVDYNIPTSQITVSGDSIIIAFNSTMINQITNGGTDTNLFENGESFILEYELTVLTCGVPTITSELMASWRCPGDDRCNYFKVNTGLATFGPALPNVILAERNVRQNECWNSNTIHRDTIVLRNNSTGGASQLIIDAGANYYSSSWRTNWSGYMDTSSFYVKINEAGAWFKPSYSVIVSMINNGFNGSCPFSGRPGTIRFNIPELGPGDSLYIVIGQVLCDMQKSCDINSIFANGANFPGTAVNFVYRNACGNATYNGGWIHGVNHRFISASGEKVGPPSIADGDSVDLGYLFTRQPNPYLNDDNANVRVIIDVPNVIQYASVSPSPVYFEDELGNIYNPHTINGDTFIFKHNDLYAGNQDRLRVLVKGVCDGVTCSGILQYTVQIDYNPDTTFCTNRNRFLCSNYNFAWTSSCTTCCVRGMQNLAYEANRLTFGLPDDNNNGIQSGTSLDLDKIELKRTIPGDTIEFLHKFAILGDLSIPSFDYVRSIMDVAATSRFSVVSDSVYWQRASSTDTSFVVTPTASSTSFTTDISSAGTYNDGDTVTIKLKLRYITNPVASFNSWNSQNGGGADTSATFDSSWSCGTFIDELVHFGVDGFSYSTGTYEFDGCEQRRVRYNHYIRIAGGDDRYDNLKFPFEIRTFVEPTSIHVVIPDGYTLDSIRFVGNSCEGGSPLPSGNLPFTTSGDTAILDVSVYYASNGGSFTPPDEGCVTSYDFYVTPSCKTTSGLTESGVTRGTWDWKIPFSSGRHEIGVNAQRNTPNFQNFHPNLIWSSPTPISTAYTSEVDWPLSVNNLTIFDGDRNWIYIESPSGDITVDSIVEGGTAITPDANGFYIIGSIPGGGTRNFTVYGRSNACEFDSIIAHTGWSCGDYPTTFTDTLCDLTPLPLYVQPQPAAIQTQITALSATPVDPSSPASGTFGKDSLTMCENIPFEMEIQSTQTGNIFNVKEFINLPFNGATGLDYVPDSGYIEYPIGSAPRKFGFRGDSVIQATIASGSMLLDLNLLDSVNFDSTKGLPGTALGTNTTRRAILRWKMTPNCQLISGSQWTSTQSAISACGEDAIGTGTDVSGYSLLIEGAPPPLDYYPVFIIVRDSLFGCDDSLTIETFLENAEPTATVAGQGIKIVLPSDVDYMPGSTVFTKNTALTTEPVVTGDTLTWMWDAVTSVPGGDSAKWSFRVGSSDATDCGMKPFEAFSFQDFTPVCSGIPCPQSIAIMQSATDTIYSAKSILTVTSNNVEILTDTGTKTPPDTLRLNLQLANAGYDTASNMRLQVYEDDNMNGIIDAGDIQRIDKILSTQVAPLSTDSVYEQLIAPNYGAFACPTIVRIIPGCDCNNDTIVSTSVCNITALPVTLGYFDVHKISVTEALISWQTLSEEHNKLFILERRVAGAPAFTQIHSRPGAGNSSQRLDYSHIDDIQELPNGRIYYRIKFVDFDGNYSYSEVKAIQKTDFGTLDIFPNPTKDVINIQTTADQVDLLNNSTVTITDAAGRIILENKLQAETLNIIDIKNTSKGIYTLSISNESGVLTTTKIVVLH